MTPLSRPSRGDARVALLYPGDRAARNRCDPAESRFAALFDAFAAAGIAARPAVYHDDFADEVEAQLHAVDVVLVWCNPIEGGRRRDVLDAMLRRVADAGVHVSAHPDAILALGTKDVLVASRDLPFGSDVHRVDSLAQLESELPQRLLGGARVLKQHRGQSGAGVWRVERDAADSTLLKVRHAQRGSEEERLAWPAFLQRMAPYFEPASGGHMIDQAWQPRLVDGMVRAYLVRDRVGGFGVQAVNALYPATGAEPPPLPGPRLYYGADLASCQGLRASLESGWVELLRERVGLARERLPLLWDCDFLLGEPDAQVERYVLCEINVSSVSPFPPSAIPLIVSAVQAQLAGCKEAASGAR
ncbi:Cj0069 family protein [Caenimonas sp. DR4.4]|uniref:Cj0069 family protein n=1 Tax=Caenimonas aquaedulcis TaxID=2793270 RepID=A0A931H928_9BURK|nr:Cj0069 family protein [Caenimonas aquaedulcis]